MVCAAATAAVATAAAATARRHAAATAAMATAATPARHCQARRQHNDQYKTHNRFQARIHWYFSGLGRRRCAAGMLHGRGWFSRDRDFLDVGRLLPADDAIPLIATSFGPWTHG